MVSFKFDKLIDIERRTGVRHPLLGGSSSFSSDDKIKNLQNQIQNYQTRLQAIGQPVPEPEDKSNILLDTLMWLDKPRNALWNAVEDSVKGENSFLQGLKEGWSQEEEYTGTQLMQDLFGKADTTAGKFGQGVAGFLAEAVADPLNLMTFGAGSLAKGFLTGTGKTLTRDMAEKLARAQLRKISREGIEQLVKRGGRELSGEALEKALKHAGYNKAKDLLTDTGVELAEREAYKSLDDVYIDAVRKLTNKILKRNKAYDGKGLSFLGKTIGGLTNRKLQDIGADWAQSLRNSGTIPGRLFGETQDFFKKIFDPSYVKGLDPQERQLFRELRRRALGRKGVADEQLIKQAKEFDQLFRQMGKLGEKERRAVAQYLEGQIPKGALSENSREVAAQMKKYYRDIAKTEREIGALTHTLDKNYFPHVPSWDNETLRRKMRLGGITGKLRLDNPSSYKRQYRTTIGVANDIKLFDTASREAKEEFLRKAGLTESQRKLTPDDIKKIYKSGKADELFDILKKGGGIENFFEEDSVKAFISRGLRHNKIVAEKEFLDDVLEVFGEAVTKNNINEYLEAGYDVVIPKNVLKVFRVGLKDYQGLKLADNLAKEGLTKGQVEKLSTNIENILKRVKEHDFNALVRVDGKDFALLAKEFPIKAYALPPGVVNEINNISRKQITEGFKALEEAIDAIYRAWKPTVTGLRPDFHIRNLAGSTYQNIMDIGFKTFDPKINDIAFRVLAGDKGTIKLADETFSLKQIKDAMVETHSKSTFFRADTRSMEDALKHEIDRFNPKRPFRSLNKLGRKAGNTIEDYVRTVNFVANLEKGLEMGLSKREAINFAGDMVRRFHFDYSELTNVEKRLLRRIMPFYTWLRKNLPLQLEMFFNDPKKYVDLLRFKENIEESYDIDTSNMPEWFEEEMPIPMPFMDMDDDGRTPYANLSLPPVELGVLSNPKDLLMGLSPFVKVPFELASNRQLITGAPIYRYPQERNTQMLKHILNQFGVLRDVSRTFNPVDDSDRAVGSASQLPLGWGSSVAKDYNPEGAYEDALYDYLRQLGNQVQYLREKGYKVPTIRELKKLGLY